MSRSGSVPPNTRDALYQGLPPNVKSALRSKLQSFQVKEEVCIPFLFCIFFFFSRLHFYSSKIRFSLKIKIHHFLKYVYQLIDLNLNVFFFPFMDKVLFLIHSILVNDFLITSFNDFIELCFCQSSYTELELHCLFWLWPNYKSKFEMMETFLQLTVPQIKDEMEKTLKWLVPIAANTTKYIW